MGRPKCIQSSCHTLLGEKGRKGFAEAFTFPNFFTHTLMTWFCGKNRVIVRNRVFGRDMLLGVKESQFGQ